MEKVMYPSLKRGIQDHGWLKAAHSFSFSNYHDPNKMGFGALRVLNDDIVAPGMGFGTHGHDNMEIITISLEGSLAHKDSLGSEGIITPGEVQVMSAGNGIRHSEYNASSSKELNLLQIWILPLERNIQPYYDQKKFAPEKFHNNFLTIVSPEHSEESLRINQNAFLSMGEFSEDIEVTYTIKNSGNGAYIFVIEGDIEATGEKLSKRDALGVSGTKEIDIMVKKGARVLIIEVPMHG